MTRLPWLARPALAVVAAVIAGCTDQPAATSPIAPTPSRDRSVATTDLATPQLIRTLAAGRGIVALPPAPHVRPALSRLGQALVFDPILSGNRNISCATCHLPAFATGDGKSLSVGEGGVGFGPPREHPNGVFIARNAPPFFNLAAMRHLFWDGRIEIDSHGRGGAAVRPAGAARRTARRRAATSPRVVLRLRGAVR